MTTPSDDEESAWSAHSGDPENERTDEDEEKKARQPEQAERRPRHGKSGSAGTGAQGDAAVREAAAELVETAVLAGADLVTALRRKEDKNRDATTDRESDQDVAVAPEPQGDVRSSDEILAGEPPAYDVAHNDPPPNYYSGRRVPVIAFDAPAVSAGDHSGRDSGFTVADAATLRSSTADTPSARTSVSSSVSTGRTPSLADTAGSRSVGRIEPTGNSMFPSPTTVSMPSAPISSISMSPAPSR